MGAASSICDGAGLQRQLQVISHKTKDQTKKMSNILKNWLNEEVKLSQSLQTWDDCLVFSNGYLLGEIMAKYNQQSNFHDFINQNTPKAKINNLCLLLPSLRAIGVHFDTKLADAVIHGKPNAVKLLLYDMKTSLDRIKRNCTLPNILATESMKNQMTLTSVVPTSKPIYDKVADKSFENTLRAMIENPKESGLLNATRKYEDNKNTLFRSIATDHSLTMSRIQDERHELYDQLRSRKRHETLFTATLDHISKEQWKVNQKIAHDRRELKRQVELKAIDKKEKRHQKNREKERVETMNNIDLFEKRLDSEIFNEEIEDESIKLCMKKMLQQPDNQSSAKIVTLLRDNFDKTQKRIIDNHSNVVLQRQSRDRHRSKYISDQESIQGKLVRHEGDRSIYMKLLTTSLTEEQEQLERSRVLEQSAILQENRITRDTLIAAMEENIESVVASSQAESIRREYDWNVCENIESQHDRVHILDIAKRSATNHHIAESVGSLIDRILDLTDWVVSYKVFGLYESTSGDQDGETDVDRGLPIPPEIWADAMRLFESDIPICNALPYPTAINDVETLPYLLSESPLCFESDYALSEPFNTHQVMPISSENAATDSNPTEYLASIDMEEYLTKVVGYDSNATEGVKSACPSPRNSTTKTKSKSPPLKEKRKGSDPSISVSISQDNLLKNSKAPEWIVLSPPSCLLGESILANYVTNSPLPLLPQQLPNELAFPIRMAIAGVSELAKTKLVTCLKRDIKGVRFINVESLIQHGIASLEENQSQQLTEIEENRNELLQTLQSYLLAGESIPDEIYVEFLVREIHSLSKDQYPNGFIIEDFPNTKSQALSLFKALTGINYDVPPAQANDRKSKVLRYRHTDSITYDPTLCGLNCVLLLKNVTFSHDDMTNQSNDETVSYENQSIQQVISERISVRKDLVSDSYYYLNPSTVDHITMIDPAIADSIIQVDTATRPNHLIGIDVSEHARSCEELENLLDSMDLLRIVALQTQDTYESILSEVSASLRDDYIVDKVDEDTNPSLEANESADHLSSHPVSEEMNHEMVQSDRITIPSKLAELMHQIWTETEQVYRSIGSEFFTALRDIRHQMSQRRRNIYDVISHHLIRKDLRQNVYEDYRNQYNHGIEYDFRYDIDCKAEYLLRSMELSDQLWSMTESRRASNDSILTSFSADTRLQSLIHLSRCEGAYFLQAELNRFFTTINILFDTVKSVCSYDSLTEIASSLEEVSSIHTRSQDLSPIHHHPASPKTNTSKGKANGKDNGSKDTGKANAGSNNGKKTKDIEKESTHLRKLIAPLITSETTMREQKEKELVGLKNDKNNVKVSLTLYPLPLVY